MRWKGYGPADDTWEPVENLQSCLDIIEEYERTKEDEKRRRADERKKKKVLELFNWWPRQYSFRKIESIFMNLK